MNQKQISKLFSLIRRTGDNAVIADTESEELFVVMGCGKYESLLNNSSSVKGLSEEEMMEKINRDISLWRQQNNSEELDYYDGGNCDITEDNAISDYDSYWNKNNDSEEVVDVPTIDEETDFYDFEEEIPFDELERDGFRVEGEELELPAMEDVRTDTDEGISSFAVETPAFSAPAELTSEEVINSLGETPNKVASLLGEAFSEDEPLYFEKAANDPLASFDPDPIDELNIEDDLTDNNENTFFSVDLEEPLVINDGLEATKEGGEFYLEPVE